MQKWPNVGRPDSIDQIFERTVQSSGKNLELAIMRTKNENGKTVSAGMDVLNVEDTEALVKTIEAERLEEQEKKKKKSSK